jgi:SAM-dependent methyltransferase
MTPSTKDLQKKTPSSYELRATAYVDKALPHGSEYEKKKLLEDWLHKEGIAQGVLRDFIKRVGDPKGKKVLDVGFGNGVTLSVFATHGAEMSGLEVSPDLLSIGSEVVQEAGNHADLRLYNGTTFPFETNSFDYGYSISVLEHMDDPVSVLKEVSRVLKPGGAFYLAFPNRFYPKETHTGWWGISYMPRGVARACISPFRHQSIDDWNLHFLSFFDLVRFLKGTDLTIRFDTRGQGLKGFAKKLLAIFGIHHTALLPHIMVVLEKKT